MRLIPWLLTLTGAIWTTGNAMIIVVAMAAFAWQRDHPSALTREGLGGALGAAMGLWSTAVGLLLLVAMVSLGWLAEQLRTFVDLNPEFEIPVERLATWLARLDDDEDIVD